MKSIDNFPALGIEKVQKHFFKNVFAVHKCTAISVHLYR